MYAQLCDSTNEIFTSVVVYSRTNRKQNPKNINRVLLTQARFIMFFGDIELLIEFFEI